MGRMFGNAGGMTPERAKAILQDRDRKLQGIDRKVELLGRELCQLESDTGLLQAAAMPHRIPGMAPGGGGHTDNLDVVSRYYRQKRERRRAVRLQLWELSGEAEEICRLWDCFLALPEPYYGILHELYVEKKLYAEVEAGFGRRHSQFEKTRKEGLSLAAWMFNSGCSGLELMEAARMWEGRKPWKEAAQGCAGQMELPLGQMAAGCGRA